MLFPHWWRLRRVRCRRIFRLADSSLPMRNMSSPITSSNPTNAKSKVDSFFLIRYLLIALMLCYLSNGFDWPRSVPLICPPIQPLLPPLSAGRRRYLDLFDTLLQGSASMWLASHWSPLERPREIIDCYPSPWSNNRLSSRSPRHFRSHFSSETAALVVIPPHLLSAF